MTIFFDPHHFSLFKDNLVDVGVEHERASVDRAHAAEALRDAPEAVDGINKGGIAEQADRVLVEFHFFDGLKSGFVQKIVIGVEGHCVTDKVYSVVL